MITPLPVGNASTLGRFFDVMRHYQKDDDARLGTFFQQFDHSYREARATRAASTPHLDVLRVFGLAFAELRHSAVLAWCLDPSAEHEQGPLFAQAFLGLFGFQEKIADVYTVERERHGRTDVSCYARGQFAVFIENKVRHFEREQQVEDMIRSMAEVSNHQNIPRERRYAVFLTDHGGPPKTAPTADSPDFLLANLFSLARMEVFECFGTALERVDASRRSPLLVNFLDSYLNSLRRLRAELS